MLARKAHTRMTDQTDTPVATLAAATQTGALPQDRLILLGTMHGPSTGRALVSHDGRVSVVQAGDTLDRATVVAVGESVVVLSRGGRAERLTLPDG